MGMPRKAGDSIDSCIPIPDRSLVATDCNDEEPQRHPAQLEICDLADNNCNGLADEGSDCGIPGGLPVIPGSGSLLPPGTVIDGGTSTSSGGGSGGGCFISSVSGQSSIFSKFVVEPIIRNLVLAILFLLIVLITAVKLGLNKIDRHNPTD